MRRLRWLVSALLVVLILGMITVAATLVIRLGGLGAGMDPPTVPALAAPGIELPEGETIVALGSRSGLVLLLTRDGSGREMLWEIDPASGEVRARVPVSRTAAEPSEP